VEASFIQPFRRIRLHIAHDLGEIHGGWKRDEEMEMMRGTSDRQSFDFHIPRDAEEIGPEVLFAIRGNNRGALLGAENAVNEVGCVGMAHLLSPLRGWFRASLATSAYALG
jgi:hypothetical protein